MSRDSIDFDLETLSGALGVILVPFFFVIITAWLAWPAWLLWGWFMVPIFGAPIITFWQSVGLVALIEYLKPMGRKETSKEVWTRYLVAPPSLALLGWVAHMMAG